MTCAQTAVTGYHAFSERVHQAAIRQRVPVTGSWEITARCNLGCAFCYLEGEPRAPGARDLELTTRQIDEVAAQLASAGCLWLALTGGEPLMRDDFPAVYRALSRRGFLLTLCTNATLVTPALADLLAEVPPLAVEVTLYGATEQIYEQVTRRPGSYVAFRRGLERLAERSVRLSLKTTLCNANVHELDAMADQARTLGAPFRFDALLNPRVDRGREPLKHRLGPERVAQLDAAPERRSALERRSAFRERFAACEAPEAPRERLLNCAAGLTSFHIDAAGRLMGCVLLREPALDLNRISFAEAWQDLAALQAWRWTRDAACRTCRWLDACAQCPGWAALECESSQSVVKHLCSTTQHRLHLLQENESTKSE